MDAYTLEYALNLDYKSSKIESVDTLKQRRKVYYDEEIEDFIDTK
jgi:hypothetical protein